MTRKATVAIFGRRFDPAILGALLGALLLVLPLVAAHLHADQKAAHPVFGRLPITELSEEEAILHAMNRLGFGPRPGEVARIREMGLETWVQRQLHPEQIDDSALEARLGRYPTLAMSSTQLLEEFPNPAMAARRAGMTPEEYRKQLEEQREQMRRRLQEQQGQMDGEAGAMSGRRGRGRGRNMTGNLEAFRGPGASWLSFRWPS